MKGVSLERCPRLVEGEVECWLGWVDDETRIGGGFSSSYVKRL